MASWSVDGRLLSSYNTQDGMVSTVTYQGGGERAGVMWLCSGDNIDGDSNGNVDIPVGWSPSWSRRRPDDT